MADRSQAVYDGSGSAECGHMEMKDSDGDGDGGRRQGRVCGAWCLLRVEDRVALTTGMGTLLVAGSGLGAAFQWSRAVLAWWR
ncbi:hypothetical protein E2562_031865, partial [Oryza meyeriana var. granulata]